MNLFKKITFTSAALLLGISAIAQTNDPPVNNGTIVNDTWKPSLTADGVIDRVEHAHRVIETPRIREIDVAWSRRVWRLIDVRQKTNQAFVYEGDAYTGGGAFIEILINGVKTGSLKAYGDERFTGEISIEDFNTTVAGTIDTVPFEDLATGELKYEINNRPFDVNSITKYRVKEDWILDRNRGKMVVEIVGLAPVQAVVDPNSQQYIGDKALFWMYYPDARNYLAKFEVYNPRNDLARMTWADYFDMRYFDSYIYKTSANNPTGKEFTKNSVRGLHEGQRAFEEIIDMSMNMWEN